jgi:alpha-mannosidase
MLFFTEDKIAKLLWEVKTTLYRETYPIPHFKFIEEDLTGAEHPDYDDTAWGDFYPATPTNSFWGGYDKIAWFRTTVPIPDHLRNKRERVAIRILAGPRDGGDSTAEALLYVEGHPLQGIDIWHENAVLPADWQRREFLKIALRAWSGTINPPVRRNFKVASLVWIDEGVWRYSHTVEILLHALKQMDETDWRRVKILESLNESTKLLRFDVPKSDDYYASVAEAADYMDKCLKEWRKIEPEKPTVVGIGHAHIDMAWLWRLQTTRDKAGRTFSTALNLMRQYPEYRFTHSSPQLYKYVQSDFPEVFEGIKEAVRRGQWGVIGGMWIEPDTNVPNGESLVRQLIYGKRYEKEHFGVDTKVLWLPDVFGYNAQLPQIVLKGGMKFFCSTKMSWNQFNRFPYDTFRWRALDGSEILVHFMSTPEDPNRPTIYTYNGQLFPFDVAWIWKNYRQKRYNDHLLNAFGWGDGGGGPTEGMLESARILENLPGFPKVTQGHVEPFFADLEKRVQDADLPVWDGELYLEYHRGTYTSQADNKRANRTVEVLYHNTEAYRSMMEVLVDARLDRDLHEGWELLLLNQFHDIIPGSSIREVYEDSAVDYRRIYEIGSGVLGMAQYIFGRNFGSEGTTIVPFNALGWERSDVISIQTVLAESFVGKGLADANGTVYPSQISGDDILFETPPVPAYGYAAFRAVDAQPIANEITVTGTTLDNRYYRIEIDPATGNITRLTDKLKAREVLTAPGNVFQAFQDKPLNFDAWDIDPFYQEYPSNFGAPREIVVEETGPVRGTLRIVWNFRASTITQRISVYRANPRIDFRTEVNWQEQQTLLKVAFPVNVRSPKATYDIPFGNVERPTHWNTSWDWARFEVPAQKWADLSEGNYGVALLNDCKYGYDIKNNVMRLTLIKSAIRPDPMADKGQHVFTYALIPHANTWREANIPHAAYEMNNPVLAQVFEAATTGSLPPQFSLASLQSDSVILETIKRAEDGDGWIFRVYEHKGNRLNAVSIVFGQAVTRAEECNLIEERIGEGSVTIDGSRLTFSITPYEIKTFRVRF